MSRLPKGQQQTWIPMGADRPCPFLWPFKGKALYGSEDPFARLDLLQRIWTSSRNFGALLDAVTITTEFGVIVDWVGLACAQIIRDPRERLAWGKQYKKDLLDIVRAQRFEEGRDPSVGFGLSRKESAAYAAESLKGTPAVTSAAAVLKLISRMKRNDERAFGRYYLYAGSIYWETEHFPRTATKDGQRLVWTWRHRSAERGNAAMRDAEAADLRDLRGRSAAGERAARETLQLYDSIRSEDRMRG